MRGARPVAALMLLAALAAPLSAAGAEADQAREALAEVVERLNALDDWFSSVRDKRAAYLEDVRAADRQVSSLAERMLRLANRMDEVEAELATLASRRETLTAEREQQAERIAEHLIAASRLTGQDFFKLLLNQKNPDHLDRMVRYHGYFTRARAAAMDRYLETLTALEENQAAIEARQRELTGQRETLRAQQASLERRRAERRTLIAALDAEMADREREREVLSADRDRLAALLEELAARAQVLDGSAFAAARGGLPWPLIGEIAHRFGQDRAGGRLTWHGVFITADAGAEVAAVHAGKVVFADWLRGFGLLTIIDHGSGYMSLYAHADALYTLPGDWVEGGEVIATAGNSGGQPTSGLYFEIRTDGTPEDPLSWLATR